MSCISLTDNASVRFGKFIKSNCQYSDKAYKSQGLARLGNFVLIPLSAGTTLADTISGIGMILAAIGTVGHYKKLNRLAVERLEISKKIIAAPLFCVLHVLNPKATISPLEQSTSRPNTLRGVAVEKPFIDSEGNGFVTHHVCGRLFHLFLDCAKSTNPIEKHVATRLTACLILIVTTITRIVDLIIGVLAFIGTLIICGQNESLNNLAYRGLQGTGLVSDLFGCILHIINPWATFQ